MLGQQIVVAICLFKIFWILDEVRWICDFEKLVKVQLVTSVWFRTSREGCKAMIRLAAQDKGQWFVTKFVHEHNHKLTTNCKFHGELPIMTILRHVC